MTAYDYNWWWDYGSPEQNVHRIPVTGTERSDDGRTLHVTAPIEAGWCIRMRLDDVTADDGTPLLHDEFSYTINRVPGAGPPTKTVLQRVEPPADRDDREAGWLRLTWGSVFEQWESVGWTLGEAELDPTDRTRFTTREGNSAIVNSQSLPFRLHQPRTVRRSADATEVHASGTIDHRHPPARRTCNRTGRQQPSPRLPRHQRRTHPGRRHSDRTCHQCLSGGRHVA